MQFQKGADKLWSYVVKYPDTMKALFVCDVGSKLSFDVMMKLYDITWSPEGSTRKALEEMTVYSFEASLQVLEGTKQIQLCHIACTIFNWMTKMFRLKSLKF